MVGSNDVFLYDNLDVYFTDDIDGLNDYLTVEEDKWLNPDEFGKVLTTTVHQVSRTPHNNTENSVRPIIAHEEQNTHTNDYYCWSNVQQLIRKTIESLLNNEYELQLLFRGTVQESKEYNSYTFETDNLPKMSDNNFTISIYPRLTHENTDNILMEIILCRGVPWGENGTVPVSSTVINGLSDNLDETLGFIHHTLEIDPVGKLPVCTLHQDNEETEE